MAKDENGRLDRVDEAVTDALKIRKAFGGKINYFGDKLAYLPSIYQLFEPDRYNRFVESYGGMGAVCRFMAAMDAANEIDFVYGEIDKDNLNVMRCLKADAGEVARRLKLYINNCAMYELAKSHYKYASDFEKAAMKIARFSNGLQSQTMMAEKARLADLPDWLIDYGEWLGWIVIEEMDALELMKKYDSKDSWHFADPPYLHRKHPSTRYKKDMKRPEDHQPLLDCVVNLKGSVMLWGYEDELYNQALASWQKIGPWNRRTSGRKYVPEYAWINYEVRPSNLKYFAEQVADRIPF